MALIRCMNHLPDGEFQTWKAAVEPVGYPETAVVCANRTHSEIQPGLVFLTDTEYDQYRHGRRVFSPVGTSAKVRVTDRVHELNETVTLPRPPEPSTTELGLEAPEHEVQSRRIIQSVQSYLWSEHWKETLSAHGTTWQTFLSTTRSANHVVEAWYDGEAEWEDVLVRYVAAFDAELRDEVV